VTEQVDEVIRVRRRQERLREELADACVSLNFDGPIGERALAELDYACFPPRHEREFPTYGALIVGGATPRWDESEHADPIHEHDADWILMADFERSALRSAPAAAPADDVPSLPAQ
jgi:hypothetical protein